MVKKFFEPMGDEEKFRTFFEPATQEQYIERWEQARRVLVELTPHEREQHFDMKDWLKVTPCGTVGCAAGLCGRDPWFRAQGFQANLAYCGSIPEADGPRMDLIYLAQFSRPESFFGDRGTNLIFRNSMRRSVDVVIAEIDEFLDALRKGLPANGDEPEELEG